MKTLLSWSTGKDSAWSFYVLRQTPGAVEAMQAFFRNFGRSLMTPA